MVVHREGYEYSYELWLDSSVIQEYDVWVGFKESRAMMYLFDMRANLKLRGIKEDMALGSERLGTWVPKNLSKEKDESERREQEVQFLAANEMRMKDDYWMPDEQIQRLSRSALNLAKQAEAEGQVLPIAVVVALEVVTVQQEGESFEAAYERAIRPDRLIPLEELWFFNVPGGKFKDLALSPLLYYNRFLQEVPRMRVEEEGSGLECGVCRCKFTVASQVSFLPCGHATHPRCLYDWVKQKRSRRSCPSCARPIPTALPE